MDYLSNSFDWDIRWLCYFVFNVETQGVKKSRAFRCVQSTILTAVGNRVLLHPNIKLVPSLSSDEGNLSPQPDGCRFHSILFNCDCLVGTVAHFRILSGSYCASIFQRTQYRRSHSIELHQHSGRFSNDCSRNSGFRSGASDHGKSGNQLEQDCENKGNSHAS